MRKFNIGYAPSYEDRQYQGRALMDSFLPHFEKDDKNFDMFADAGLVRLFNDATVKGYGYYCRQIDFRRQDLFSRNYGDTLAGKIVFPINDADANPQGFIGRRPDDSGVRRLKQQSSEIPLSTKGWLYGFDKAKQYIKQYRTIIIVEGIFDYFAFYDLLQARDKPVVVSTLGSYLQKEAESTLKDLAIEHFIVAYNWDVAGKDGIERIASRIGGWVYYLGGPAEGQEPYDLLKPAVTAIRGFSLEPHKPMRNAKAEKRR